MAEIRRGTAQDVAGIGAVIADAWDGLAIDEGYCQALIEEGEQHVWVAEEDGDIVGFVSGFATTTQGAVRRWEVDLLAVHSSHTNQGLGTQLVGAAWQDAEEHQAKFARGLVRVDNFAAKRAFEKVGYETSGQVYNLILWSPSGSDARYPQSTMITATPVDTFTYRGIWLEGMDIMLISDSDRMASIAAARTHAAREERDNVGAVIPVDRPLAANVRGDGWVHAQYQWWRKP